MGNINLLTDVPEIKNRAQLKQWLKPLYILSEYTVDFDTYRVFQQKMYNILKGCFTIRACREFPIRFKFTKKETETHELQFRHFVVNLMALFPFVELNDLDVLDESYLLDCMNDIPRLENYINEKLILTLREYHIKGTKINYDMSEVLGNLRSISLDFSVIMGLSFSAPMFIDLYDTIPEMRELMECTFDDGMQPYEIERKLDEYEAREIELLRHLPNNALGVLLRADTGVKHKQLREFTISEGLKPTLDGKTIPIPIENSTLLRGLDRPSYLYIDALGARKSLNRNITGDVKPLFCGELLVA